MVEAIHLPRFLAISTCVEDSIQPCIVRAQRFREQPRFLNRILVIGIPKHLQYLLLP